MFLRFDMETFNEENILTAGRHILHCTAMFKPFSDFWIKCIFKFPALESIFIRRHNGNCPTGCLALAMWSDLVVRRGALQIQTKGPCLQWKFAFSLLPWLTCKHKTISNATLNVNFLKLLKNRPYLQNNNQKVG